MTQYRAKKSDPVFREAHNARGRRWRANNPDKVRKYSRITALRRYGLTPEQYEERLAGQGGVCAICGSGPEASIRGVLHVDHDHATGQVRGLLCGGCNVALGALNEDPTRLHAAIEYLKKAGTTNG